MRWPRSLSGLLVAAFAASCGSDGEVAGGGQGSGGSGSGGAPGDASGAGGAVPDGSSAGGNAGGGGSGGAIGGAGGGGSGGGGGAGALPGDAGPDTADASTDGATIDASIEGGDASGSGGVDAGTGGAGGDAATDARLDASGGGTGGAGAGGTSGSGGSGGGGSGGASGSGGTGGGGGAGGSGGTGGGGAGGSGGTTSDASTDAMADAPAEGGQCLGVPDAGAISLCTRDADCCASGRVCGEIVSGPPTVARCAGPFPGGGGFGTPCSGLSMNPLCASGICYTAGGGCTALCASDGDCRAVDPAYVCHGLTVSGSPMGLCVRECTGDPACPAGQNCRLSASATVNRYDKYCRVAPASGDPPGSPCTTPGLCDHGLCATIGASSVCTAPCETPADCPPAAPSCLDFQLTLPQGGTVMLGLCVP